MSLFTLEELLAYELKDLYSAETQLIDALSEMASAANDADLTDAFDSHLEETRGHVRLLEEVGAMLEIEIQGSTCKAMKGLIEECEDAAGMGGGAALRDLALIVIAQKIEHYEISGYGSAKALADQLGFYEMADILEGIQTEENMADSLLTQIAEKLHDQALVERPLETFQTSGSTRIDD